MTGELAKQKRQLCDLQGRIFELSLKKGYDSPRFMERFMNSGVSAALDESYDRLQWMGEAYILECLVRENGEFVPAGTKYANEILYWSGYLYRYWHYFTGASSRRIYEQANADTMNEVYCGFHILDPPLAVEDIKELYRQKLGDERDLYEGIIYNRRGGKAI